MKLRRRKPRKVPGINTASIADISFTLLILFLVVTSMDDDKGLSRLLPPEAPATEQPAVITKRNVLEVTLTADNQMLVNGDTMLIGKLKEKVMTFVDNPDNDADLPEKNPHQIELLGKCMVTDAHVIRLAADRQTSYETYFKVQNVIADAYRQLREDLAQKRFGCSYVACSEKQRAALREYYPQRVSELYAKEGGLP